MGEWTGHPWMGNALPDLKADMLKEIGAPSIDALFDEPVKWRLIETLLPDLLRVGMSIKAGRLTPSTLGQTHLKQTKLGSNTRHPTRP